MGYTFVCDGCGEPGDTPALMGQFRERWFVGSPLGDRLKQAGYELGDTVTLCGDCAVELLE